MSKQTCPKCSSSKVIYCLFGFPRGGGDFEMYAKEQGYYKVELMGCDITDPGLIYNHECYDCRYQWWASDTDEDD